MSYVMLLGEPYNKFYYGVVCRIYIYPFFYWIILPPLKF